MAQLRYERGRILTPSKWHRANNTGALDDIQEALVGQKKIRPHISKYGGTATPYCTWLTTTPTYRILKAFKGLKPQGE